MNRRDFMKTGMMAGAVASMGSTQTPPPSDRITVGVIGSGARAQELMTDAMRIAGVEIVAVCDAYAGRAERARARTKGRATIHRTYREVLDRNDIDAVIVGTPDHWHRTMVVDALNAGKDVYVEKPMTYAIDEGPEIIRAVQQNKRVLQVGSQGISTETARTARELVKSGRLGQVTMVRASNNRNTAGGAWIYPIPPDASPATVDWDQFLGPAPKRPLSLERFFRWRCYWDYSGGISTDLFVHLLTSLHYILDAKMPRTVVATGELYRWKESREVPDTLNALLVYPEGFTMNLSATFNNEFDSGQGLQILGTEGTLVVGGGALTFTAEHTYDDNRWVVASWPEELERAHYANPKIQALESPATWAPQIQETREIWQESGQGSTMSHLANFFDAVRTRQQPNEDATVGHRAAAAAHLVNLSVRQQRALEWDAARDRMKA
jgi:predicted dehydrogenase